MTAFVEVTVLSVSCAEMESSAAQHDIFALTGAVIADGKVHGFAFPVVALRTGWSWNYNTTIFSGFVDDSTIGFGAVGFDVDDSDWWVKNEDDVRKVTEMIELILGETPQPGPIIGKVINKIPDVVDFFTSEDKNDEVFRCSEDIPAPQLAPGQSRTELKEWRTKGSAEAGFPISDWEYSIAIAITWTMSVPTFPNPPLSRSTIGLSGSEVADWIGEWETQGLYCNVLPSPGSTQTEGKFDAIGAFHRRSLDVSMIEYLPSGQVKTTTEDAPIQRISIAVTPSGNGKEAIPVNIDAPPVVEIAKHDGDGIVVKKFSPIGAFLEVKEGTPAQSTSPVPILLSLSGDRVELIDGGILEIRDELVNGEKIGTRVLRYVKPARAADLIISAPVDVEFHRKRNGP